MIINSETYLQLQAEIKNVTPVVLDSMTIHSGAERIALFNYKL
jgi:hypothetical protein